MQPIGVSNHWTTKYPSIHRWNKRSCENVIVPLEIAIRFVPRQPRFSNLSAQRNSGCLDERGYWSIASILDPRYFIGRCPLRMVGLRGIDWSH